MYCAPEKPFAALTPEDRVAIGVPPISKTSFLYIFTLPLTTITKDENKFLASVSFITFIKEKDTHKHTPYFLINMSPPGKSQGKTAAGASQASQERSTKLAVADKKVKMPHATVMGVNDDIGLLSEPPKFDLLGDP